MKHAGDKSLVICSITLCVLLLALRCSAAQYEYKGVYPVEAVMVNLCENCFLKLPPEYLQSNITLSVKTDKVKELERALVDASAAVGWQLRKVGGGWRAEPVQNDGNLVFISCMTSEPVNVPKYLYSFSVRADSIKCAARDSSKAYADSVAAHARHVADSIAALPPLDYRQYELRYYSYTQSFADRLGVSWPSTWAMGNLHDKLQVFDDWALMATETNDTAFTHRRLLFSLDSTLAVDWGSEEQTLKTTFVNDGVTTSDYEWRKYGLIVQVQRDGRRVRMQYTFRDKSSGVSLLQGSAIGAEADTLRMQGTYSSTRSVMRGIPFLCSLPVVGYLFGTEDAVTENRAFELYLLPVDDAYYRGQLQNELSRDTTHTTKEKGAM